MLRVVIIIMVCFGATLAFGAYTGMRTSNAAVSGVMDDRPLLGRKLFFDASLSEPTGQACASCHLPTAGFADPDAEIPVSRGVNPLHVGKRNAPTIAYAAFSPPFHFDPNEKLYIGGFFHDGRTHTLEEQAKGPFLNPQEMANPDAADIVAFLRTLSDGYRMRVADGR